MIIPEPQSGFHQIIAYPIKYVIKNAVGSSQLTKDFGISIKYSIPSSLIFSMIKTPNRNNNNKVTILPYINDTYFKFVFCFHIFLLLNVCCFLALPIGMVIPSQGMATNVSIPLAIGIKRPKSRPDLFMILRPPIEINTK